MKKHKYLQNNRKSYLRGFITLIIGIFVLFVFRFGQIMIGGTVNNQDLKANALVLHERSSMLQAKRGTIYDIGGNPIAMDATSYSLLAILTDQWSDANPVHVEDKDHTAEVLSKHIDMSKEDILKILNTKDVNQVEFGSAGQNLSYAEMQAIQKEELQGITFEETPTRLYPNGTFASHLIGYASFKEAQDSLESRLAGELGIELSEDEVLKGKNGTQLSTANHDNYDISTNKVTAPQEGHDVYTTIDSRLQTYMESLLSEVDSNYAPEKMTAMLVDPNTGKIVAASQRPTFNAQTKEGLEDMWQNLLVETPYEPGSTIKVLTIAAAIEEGVFDPNGTYQSGSVTIGNSTISDYNKVGWGTISELEGLAHSSNVLVVKLVSEMGYDTWKEYLYEFGLLQKPQSGLANEASGSMNFDYEFEKASTSFGQGIYVTPWQMMQAFTAIANDGNMMTLQYIDRYEDESGNLVTVDSQKKTQPISKETANKTLDYLSQTMDIAGSTTEGYKIEGKDLAVKTGTAEIYDTDKNAYLTGTFDYLYSVVGFAPVDDPQYILYITMERPQKNTNDGTQKMLSDVFIPLMTRALDYGSLDTGSGYDTAEMIDVVGTNKNAAQQQLSQAGFLRVNVLGDGDNVIDQVPNNTENYSLGSPVYLLTDGDAKMPDFSGMDIKMAQAVADMLDLQIEFEGEGIIVAQSVAAGSGINPKDSVVVQLQES